MTKIALFAFIIEIDPVVIVLPQTAREADAFANMSMTDPYVASVFSASALAQGFCSRRRLQGETETLKYAAFKQARAVTARISKRAGSFDHSALPESGREIRIGQEILPAWDELRSSFAFTNDKKLSDVLSAFVCFVAGFGRRPTHQHQSRGRKAAPSRPGLAGIIISSCRAI